MTTVTYLHLAIISLMITVATSQTPPTTSTYINHTVGGNAGWFFNSTTNTPAANYSSWAASQTFNLGDYLIFRTSTNQTVVQTYNETTFGNCTIDYASDNDTFLYDAGNQVFDQALTISIPLTIEGPNYYFSEADDGLQCLNGMAFEIQVNHGLGLPPSLNQPPPPPYMEPPGPDTAQSPPVTINGGSQVPGNGGVRGGVNAIAVAFALLLTITGLRL